MQTGSSVIGFQSPNQISCALRDDTHAEQPQLIFATPFSLGSLWVIFSTVFPQADSFPRFSTFPTAAARATILRMNIPYLADVLIYTYNYTTLESSKFSPSSCGFYNQITFKSTLTDRLFLLRVLWNSHFVLTRKKAIPRQIYKRGQKVTAPYKRRRRWGARCS